MLLTCFSLFSPTSQRLFPLRQSNHSATAPWEEHLFGPGWATGAVRPSPTCQNMSFWGLCWPWCWAYIRVISCYINLYHISFNIVYIYIYIWSSSNIKRMIVASQYVWSFIMIRVCCMIGFPMVTNCLDQAICRHIYIYIYIFTYDQNPISR